MVVLKGGVAYVKLLLLQREERYFQGPSIRMNVLQYKLQTSNSERFLYMGGILRFSLQTDADVFQGQFDLMKKFCFFRFFI